jgi:hypothetical protein
LAERFEAREKARTRASSYAPGLAIHVYRPRSSPADRPVDTDLREQVG